MNHPNPMTTDLLALAEMEAIFLPPISDSELEELAKTNPPLAHKCSGCAYRMGTDAANNPTTAANRDDCDRAGHPFWCHMVRNDLGMPVHLCAGWVDARASLHPSEKGEG
ncbi:hypothetical protein [Sphingobium sp. TCM1]|uniref:hypothetical protein n=1 Tax=Sphingobium sp. TCM1 TaxID=453246 RepID=UPI0007F47E37|nr:hypothetical protein [Sphingobium sp. TCM1]OAN56913.1 hypothetical protein A7Q26_17605 [Sphingobium sp. TCM1]